MVVDVRGDAKVRYVQETDAGSPVVSDLDDIYRILWVLIVMQLCVLLAVFVRG